MRTLIRETYEPLLQDDKQEIAVRIRRPTKPGEEVLDDATFKTIEVDKLFDAIDTSITVVGQATLYRSLSHPLTSAEVINAKQEALRELDSNPKLLDQIESLLVQAARYEKDFFKLLFGTFIGLMASPQQKTDVEGYGYKHFKNGTKFMLDLVRHARDLPNPESPYLRALIEEIREFGATRSSQLMAGPIYLTERGLKTQTEKARFVPAIRFRPTLFKPVLIGAMLAASIIITQVMPMVGDTFSSGAPLLFALLLPGFLLYVPAVGGFDRESIIYPLRNDYRKSAEVQHTLDAMGKLDELLSFHRYAKVFGSSMILPTITDSDRHSVSLIQVRNPTLGKGHPGYVPNDITLNRDRTTFVTGPNSGGKTAFCKTLTQTQLLAQVGCYVPAEKAEMTVADRIFYQAPEMSSLEDEEGRFGTELKHTKAIFLAATPRSLVILDELSEGTTFEEKLETSYNVLKGFSRIGSTTLLITHNHHLVDRFMKERIGQCRQLEFAGDAPTYRLIEGISRVSHADRVARKIGFAKEDIERILVERGL
jgi:hypothetical protein